MDTNIKEGCTSDKNIVSVIKKLIKEDQFDSCNRLSTALGELQKNVERITTVSIDLYHEICYIYLNDKTYKEDLALYNRAEDLLYIVATYAPFEELLLELLELIEDHITSHQIFSTVLKALQILLLKQKNQYKPHALGWTLNSIKTYLKRLTLPEYLKEGYGVEEKHLLEQDEDILNYITHYITIGYFYDPLLNDICQNELNFTDKIFRECTLNKRNVLCCFLLTLLGEPISCLNLDVVDTQKTNTYTLQCAFSLTKAVTKCITDPYYFMFIIENHALWKEKSKKSRYREKICTNIFISDDQVTLQSIAIYYYMIFVGKVDQEKVPLVYHPMFVCESILHLAYKLLCSDCVPLHEKGIELAQCLFQQLHDAYKIPIWDLEVKFHQSFFHTLCDLAVYSSQTHIRQKAIRLLLNYILKFDDEAKYLIIKYLMSCIPHTGIIGYLTIIYKDLVAAALQANTSKLPIWFSGKMFRSIYLQHICYLPKGLETDLIDQADAIISSLNTLRFFAANDHDNRTGFWSFVKDLEHNYITPLRKGLNLSRAHNQAELKRIENGVTNMFEEVHQHESLKLVNLSIANSNKKSADDSEVTKEDKIYILKKNLCTLDVMHFLLGQVTECLSNTSKLEYK